jgi:hypothetical protein
MNYLKRLAKWFLEGKSLYLFIIIVLFLFHLDKIDIGLRPVDNLRVYGLLLQICGTLTIVYSLKEKLILFKGYGFGKFFSDYFKKFPLRQIKRNISVEVGTGRLTFTGAEVRAKIGPKEDPKDIIRYFNEEIEYLHKRITKDKNESKADLSKIKADLLFSKANISIELEKTNVSSCSSPC